jgi:hypothetical protein
MKTVSVRLEEHAAMILMIKKEEINDAYEKEKPYIT